MQVEINGHVYTVHSEESQTFRCGKTVTSVTLRKEDTEIETTTSGDWKQLLGVKPEEVGNENQNI